jgi:hypothetical protein
MASLMSAVKSFAEPALWLDALYITAGVIGSGVLNGLVASKLPIPGVLQAFVGPVLIVFAGSLIGDRIGRGLKLGAFVHAASTVLSMVGLPGVKA